MRRRVFQAALCAAIVVAGCGSGGSNDSDDSDPADAERVAETTAAPTAMVAQYASVVAEHKVAIDEWIDFETTCDVIDCLFADNVVSRYEVLAGNLTTFREDLRVLDEPNPMIAELVARTSAAIQDTRGALTSFTSCAVIRGSIIDECGEAWEAAEEAWRALPSLLAAWEPYL